MPGAVGGLPQCLAIRLEAIDWTKTVGLNIHCATTRRRKIWTYIEADRVKSRIDPFLEDFTN